MNKIIFSLMLLVFAKPIAFSQSVGIGTTTPDASSVLEVKSTTKGFLPPRMTASEKGLIPSPKAGLLIYQTDATPGLYVYNGSAWVPVAAGGTVTGGWSLTGNGGTSATNFIGTTDAKPLTFKVQNTYAGRIGEDGSVALGKGASAGSFTHPSIVAVGYNTLTNNGDGAVGIFQGTANTALGSEAASLNTTGSFNTANGYQALKNNISGASNTAIGSGALFSTTTASNNTATGYNALYLNETGTSNTAMGYRSLTFNKIGNENTALGYQALNANLGNWNTAIGSSALTANTTATLNTAVGQNALLQATTGGSNTAVGASALKQNNGFSNVAFGAVALGQNTTGKDNTAVGSSSMGGNKTGSGNTGVGTQSLLRNFTGSYNTTLGYHADLFGTDAVNATAIGANAMAACDNCVVLGSVNGSNDATSDVKVGIGVTNPLSNLHVNPNGPGSILVGTKENTGTYLDMGVTAKFSGSGYVQAVQASNSSFGALLLNPLGGYTGVGYPSVSNINSTLDVNGSIGLRSGSNKWQIYNFSNLLFDFNGVTKAGISYIDGHYVEYSDARLKKNVQKMQPGVLAKVLALQPKTYQYIANENTQFANNVSTGFIAQEVKELFPTLVTEMPNNGKDSLTIPNYLGINYAGFSVIAIKAIQEQQEQIETLKAENTLMKAEFAKMREAIEALQKK